MNWNLRETAVYSLSTKLLGLLLMNFRDEQPYLMDDLGGDFKLYVANHEFENKWARTIQNLDSTSLKTIETLKNRFLSLPNKREVHINSGYSFKYLFKKTPLKELLDIEKSKNLRRFINKAIKFWQFPGLDIEDSVFYYKHGLDRISSRSTEYLKGTDFLDIGSFHGDSAIALLEFEYRKIHCFDISSKSTERLEFNLNRIGLNPTKYNSILAKVGSINGSSMISNDTGKSNFSDTHHNEINKAVDYYVPNITIDDYCESNNLTPKLMKADVEGALMDVVLGAKHTIQKNRPILTLAIYHNPVEFFEVKPFLESIVDNYKFEIRKLTHRTGRNSSHIETFLIGTPIEIC